MKLEQWSSDSNDTPPGGGNTIQPIQLDAEHTQFLNGLPGFLSYREGRSSTYFCPCSPAMKDWHRGIKMDDWEGNVRQRCKGNYKGIGPLLDHCRNLGDVDHLGFAEYAQTVTGGVQGPRLRTGCDAVCAADGTNAQPRQPSPLAARASDARARHE